MMHMFTTFLFKIEKYVFINTLNCNYSVGSLIINGLFTAVCSIFVEDITWSLGSVMLGLKPVKGANVSDENFQTICKTICKTSSGGKGPLIIRQVTHP